jgi:GT2 family glycosyltransferase
MKLSIQLVTWNGAKYMPFLFESLKSQTFKDWDFFILDNASQDNTAEIIKKELSNFGVQSELIENKENLGFAGGHNFLFKIINSEYVLFLNQDMYLMPDCLEKMVNFMDSHSDAGALSPRLMKWNFVDLENYSLPRTFSNQVDSLGLKVFWNRRVVEQFAQEDWDNIRNKFGNSIQVFGVSGGLPMYRKTAVSEIVYPDGGVLDEDYHSYKEDVDIAYRLAARGYKSYVIIDAVAYHDRSAAGPKNLNDRSAAGNKKNQSEWVKYHSYKNHIMTLYKNEYWQNFIIDFFSIIWYELRKFVYFLLFDRRVLSGLKDVWKNRGNLAVKRRFVKGLRKIGWKEMRKNWSL